MDKRELIKTSEFLFTILNDKKDLDIIKKKSLNLGIEPHQFINHNNENIFTVCFKIEEEDDSFRLIKGLYYWINDKKKFANLVNHKQFTYINITEYIDEKHRKIFFTNKKEETEYLKKILKKYKIRHRNDLANYHKVFITIPWKKNIKEIYNFLNKEIKFEYQEDELLKMIEKCQNSIKKDIKVEICKSNIIFYKKLLLY